MSKNLHVLLERAFSLTHTERKDWFRICPMEKRNWYLRWKNNNDWIRFLKAGVYRHVISKHVSYLPTKILVEIVIKSLAYLRRNKRDLMNSSETLISYGWQYYWYDNLCVRLTGYNNLVRFWTNVNLTFLSLSRIIHPLLSRSLLIHAFPSSPSSEFLVQFFPATAGYIPVFFSGSN